MTSHNLNNRYLWEAILMKKFFTAIIISFVVTVSSAGIKVAAFSSSNLGAAFVLSNVMSDEKTIKMAVV